MVHFHSLLLLFLSLYAFITKLLQHLSSLCIRFAHRVLCVVSKKRCVWASISTIQLPHLSEGFTYPKDACFQLIFMVFNHCLKSQIPPAVPVTSPHLQPYCCFRILLGTVNRCHCLKPTSMNYCDQAVQDWIIMCVHGREYINFASGVLDLKSSYFFPQNFVRAVPSSIRRSIGKKTANNPVRAQIIIRTEKFEIHCAEFCY